MFKIDKELKALIPQLSKEEFEQLEKNILAEGQRDPIIVWPVDDDYIIVDGHNRFQIGLKHNPQTPCNYIEKHFNSKSEVIEWMIHNQLGRRNLSAYDRSILALRLKPMFEEKAKENILATQNNKMASAFQKSGKQVHTSKELAKVAGVSHDTIAKVQKIQEKAPEGVKEKIKSGEVSINQAYKDITQKEKQEKRQKEFKEKETETNNTWKDDNIIIKHGDAFELIKDITDGSVDLVLTDLPYNCSRENNFKTIGRQGIDFGEWDKIDNYDKFLQNTVTEISRTLRNGGSFYIFANIINVSDLWRHLESNGLTPKRVMVWEKTNPIPTNQDRLYLAASEMFIWGTKGDKWTFNSKYESNVMRFATITDSDKRFHPTQKPDELFEKLINISSNPGDLVLDPFSGSGTTAFNCKKLKRRFVGFELDEIFYKKTLTRLAGVK